ncbi:MAG: SsrA-binding protein SmpB [Bacteroidia bacterium]|nr:SsrA-binding protein SmpB [Bacteroidia bacterium]MDW8159001.1 SsrA-binding protein SmpB [Bacteroidia bacterium]
MAENFQPTITNRKAAHDYHFIELYDAGIVLKGTEIKSIRQGKVQMQDAFCYFDKDELYIKNLQISPYEQGNIHNHDPKRPRKLLLTKLQLRRLKNKVSESGLTIIPVKIFFNERNYAKIQIALARGKKAYDKRESIKERDLTREKQRYSEYY